MCTPGQLVQLCDQREEEVWVEAPRSTHTARHSQHLPKGTGGLGNKRHTQVGAHCTQNRDEASDARRTQGCVCLGRCPAAPPCPSLPATLGRGGGVPWLGHLRTVPPAQVPPCPSAPTAAAAAPAHSHAGSGPDCSTARPPPWGCRCLTQGPTLGWQETPGQSGGSHEDCSGGRAGKTSPRPQPQRNQMSSIRADQNRAGAVGPAAWCGLVTTNRTWHDKQSRRKQNQIAPPGVDELKSQGHGSHPACSPRLSAHP